LPFVEGSKFGNTATLITLIILISLLWAYRYAEVTVKKRWNYYLKEIPGSCIDDAFFSEWHWSYFHWFLTQYLFLTICAFLHWF
jgi:hypothetical protein